MKNRIDPRTKLFFVVCFSTLGVVFENLYVLLAVFSIEILFALMLRVNVLAIMFRLKKIFFVVIGIVVIKSLFMSTGNTLIGYKDIKILTDVGLIKGGEYLLRVLIIFMSGTIITTSSIRDVIQGIVQLKLPYDVALMVSIGIKFIPLLVEQFKDTVTAIALRGINIKKLKLKRKIEIYLYIFTPVIVNTLSKARQLTLSIETRGFRAFDKRTSITTLRFKLIDYMTMVISVALTVVIVYLYKYL